MTRRFAQLEKPTIALLPQAIAPYPAKNYIWNLLFQDLKAMSPKRTLDAACGKLRNYWMFKSGIYCGIDRNHAEYLKGLASSQTKELIRARGADRLELYLGDMDHVLPFLGRFDICVSTGTLGYLDDPTKAVRDMAGAVTLGGAMFVTYRRDGSQGNSIAEEWATELAEQFDTVDLVYYGSAEAESVEARLRAPDLDKKERRRLILEYSQIEARVANRPDNHYAFYLRATGKNTAPIAQRAPLKTELLEGGVLRIQR